MRARQPVERLLAELRRGDEQEALHGARLDLREGQLLALVRLRASTAAQLVDLSKELQQEIEKNESYVLSLGTLKKTDEIEKLVKRIRSRLRHN